MTRSGGSFMLLLIFSFFIVFFGLIQAQDIPQKFFGAFQLDHSDNWDAYLAAKGYDEQTRKTVKLPKITRILFPKEPGVYRMMVGTGLEGSRWVKGSKKNADWSFRLGSQFQAKYWDGNQHLILFTYDPTSDRLTERHTVVGSQAAPESFVYNINAEGNLDSVGICQFRKMSRKGVSPHTFSTSCSTVSS